MTAVSGQGAKWSAALGMRAAFAAVLLLTVLTACSMPGDAAPVLKLGVIAPFEGRERALGYAILPAVKEEVAEANASGEFGNYRVLVVAFNDNYETAAARQQAEALALDPSVFGVVGPLTLDAAHAAAAVLAPANIQMMPFFPASEAKDFSQAQAGAKKMTRALLDALVTDIREHGRPVGPRPGLP